MDDEAAVGEVAGVAVVDVAVAGADAGETDVTEGGGLGGAE